ncbi:MAG: secondary thiamine-phosphate synthase enzyme YjbQ [Thermoplasmata archaeon]
MLEALEVSTHRRSEMIDITAEVLEVVRRSGVRSGLCVVWVPHTTAGVTVNENADPSVRRDILMALERLVPRDAGYAHSEGNSDSHIKASLVGHSATLIVDEGSLLLGTWQGIYLCEFDGPRRRRVVVKIIGGAGEGG